MKGTPFTIQSAAYNIPSKKGEFKFAKAGIKLNGGNANRFAYVTAPAATASGIPLALLISELGTNYDATPNTRPYTKSIIPIEPRTFSTADKPPSTTMPDKTPIMIEPTHTGIFQN